MRLRSGELTALAGIGCVVASLLLWWYETPSGNLDFWDTFGPGAALMLAALAAALALVASALFEREGPALPIAAAVWAVPLGLAGSIAALVRVLERPQHATAVCGGAWLGLAGTLLIVIGAWLAIRDERTSRYRPATPEPRPRP